MENHNENLANDNSEYLFEDFRNEPITNGSESSLQLKNYRENLEPNSEGEISIESVEKFLHTMTENGLI